MKKLIPLVMVLALALVSGSFLTANPQDSPCKDLKKTECEKKKNCCWVKGHEQKGKKVHGYCRQCGK
jgi:hypothetical protein